MTSVDTLVLYLTLLNSSSEQFLSANFLNHFDSLKKWVSDSKECIIISHSSAINNCCNLLSGLCLTVAEPRLPLTHNPAAVTRVCPQVALTGPLIIFIEWCYSGNDISKMGFACVPSEQFSRAHFCLVLDTEEDPSAEVTLTVLAVFQMENNHQRLVTRQRNHRVKLRG